MRMEISETERQGHEVKQGGNRDEWRSVGDGMGIEWR